MYIHLSVCVCESRRCFFSLLSLKYITYSFFCSLCSLIPACCRAPLVSITPQARGHPCPSLLPSFPLLALRSSCLLCVPWLPCVSCCVPFRLPVPVPCSVLCVCALKLSGGLPCVRVCVLPAVTRQPSGARRCDSVGRCTAYMSPALSPPVYVLPCVPLSVPCVCPAAVCPLAAIIAGTPLYRGRRLFGAASVM